VFVIPAQPGITNTPWIIPDIALVVRLLISESGSPPAAGLLLLFL
jgi:hypothetical protein